MRPDKTGQSSGSGGWNQFSLSFVNKLKQSSQKGKVIVMKDIIVTDVAGVPGSASLLVQHDGKAFMYDMGFGFCAGTMADKVEEILGGAKPDEIILTHSHYDHVMGAAVLADRWSGVPVTAGDYAAYIFTRPSAKKLMFDMDENAAMEMGCPGSGEDYTDKLHIDRTLKDGDVIKICGLTLETIAFPGHTKCSIGFYCPEHKTLFSSETMGVYGGEHIMPLPLTSYIQATESLERAAAYDVEHIVLPHWGKISGKDVCRAYFDEAVSEFDWMRENVIKLHNSGMEDKDIIEKMRERYHNGHIGSVYPVKAFYLNTGYTVPLIIKEYCSD